MQATTCKRPLGGRVAAFAITFALAAGATAQIAAPPAADAHSPYGVIVDWCGALIYPDSWSCVFYRASTFEHYADENAAKYKGSGSVPVCSKFVRISDGHDLYRGCNYNYRTTGFHPACTLRRSPIGNGSGNRHTLWGDTNDSYQDC